MQGIKIPLNTLRKDTSKHFFRMLLDWLHVCLFCCVNKSHWFDSFHCNHLWVETKVSKYHLKLANKNILLLYLEQKQEIWLTVYSRSSLIGVTYSLTHSLIHWLTHNILQTRWLRGIFLQKNNSKINTALRVQSWCKIVLEANNY